MSQDNTVTTTPTTGAPTPKEAMFFLAILNNMKNKPEVSISLYPLPSSTNSRFHQGCSAANTIWSSTVHLSIKFNATFKQNRALTSLPQVDWEVVAQKSGFSNGKTASTRFGQIKKKWSAMSSDIDTTSSTTPSPKTPKSTTSKENKTMAGSGTNTTPSKVTKKSPAVRGRGRKPKAVKEEEAEENGAEGDADMSDDAPAAENTEEEVEYFEAEEDEVEVEVEA
jgi:hypothetical protein